MNVELYRWPGYIVMYKPLSVFWDSIDVSQSVQYECQEFAHPMVIAKITEHEVSML